MLLFATPLMAQDAASPGRDEAERSLELIAGKVRAAYAKSKTLDSKLTLQTLIDKDELSGRYCDASNFGLHIESAEPPLVLLVYRRRFDYQPEEFHWRLELRKQTHEAINKTAPEGVGQSPWPPDRELHENRLRNFWWRAHRWYYFAGLSLTAVIAGAWLVLRNKWFSLRGPR
ncbi:MAG: hypothetical protein IT461_06605 [Planctomycetes bacterium]|nr:hypothetical protein [Planctomycetota bacterium]